MTSKTGDNTDMSIDHEATSISRNRPSEGLSPAKAANQCGACQTANSTDSKFCAGCGQSLYEPCVGCKESVMLTQKFCNSCGADLFAALDKRRKKIDATIADVVELVKRSDFDTASALLRQVCKTGDFRLADSISQAEKVLLRVAHLRDRAEANATALQEKASKAAKENDHERVVALLKKVPEGLLSDASRSQMRQSKSTIEQLVTLNTELQSAMAARNWQLLGSLVGQLLVLAPTNTNYQQIAAKVSQRLVELAKKRFDERELARAAELLDSVPDCQRDETYEALLGQISDLAWLTDEVESEPFATIGLGRLAVRLAKQGEQAADKELVKQLAANIKTKPQGRNGLNPWKGNRESWIGGEIGILAQTTRINTSDVIVKQLLQHNSQWNVAIGLAIQGVDAGRVTACFLPAKKGLLNSLSRRKSKSAWGIDLGATGLRAVLMTPSADGLTIEDVYVDVFDSPKNRLSAENSTSDPARAGLEKFAAEKKSRLADVPIWINVAAEEIVNRSIGLPPLKDKQAAPLLETEIDQLLPMDKAELSVVSWMAPLHEDPTKGRPAMIAACRKVAIERLVGLANAAGLTLAGIQSSAVALANFAAYEFSDELTVEQNDGSPTAIVLVDSGAAATSAVMVTDRSINILTFDNAGEELTKALARETKTKLSDADLLKHDPATISSPSTTFPVLEDRMDALRQRLERHFEQTKIGNFPPTVIQTWVVGGGARCHGWIKHVLSKHSRLA
ncbi:MAG: pilus assembly protein PilM [Pirellulaceae bacterium]